VAHEKENEHRRSSIMWKMDREKKEHTKMLVMLLMAQAVCLLPFVALSTPFEFTLIWFSGFLVFYTLGISYSIGGACASYALNKSLPVGGITGMALFAILSRGIQWESMTYTMFVIISPMPIAGFGLGKLLFKKPILTATCYTLLMGFLICVTLYFFFLMLGGVYPSARG
jgi:hypothetical protein